MKVSDLQELDRSINIKTGNPDGFIINGICQSEEPVENTFTFLKNKRYLNSLGGKVAGSSYPKTGIMVEEDFWDKMDDAQKSGVATSFAWVATLKSVSEGMCTLSKPFYDALYSNLNYQVDGRQMGEVQIDPSAEISQGVFIGEKAVIGKNVKIMSGCVIQPRVSIGDDTIIFPNVTIYPYTQIGERCRIHAGTVIGTDGFGHNFFDGKHQKVWHLAGVEIKNDVEIGCNSMVDSGAFTKTCIGNGTKIDNDVQVSHNVKIHNHVVICGTTGIAGSVEVQDYAGFGAGVGVGPAAKIGKGAQIAARAVVSENTIVADGEVMAGHPARPLRDWLRAQAVLRKLSKK